MSFDTFFLKRMKEHVADHSDLDVLAFKRFYIYCLIFLSVLILWSTTILSFYNNHSSIAPSLLFISGLFILDAIILYLKPHLLLQVQYIALIICCALGIALLTHDGSYNPVYSLVWFVMLASMIMFTLGLYHGTILFFTYFILLTIMLVLPYDFGVSEKVNQGARIRLLIAMFGTFMYSWAAEYVRHKTQLALTTLLLETEKRAHTDNLTGLRNRHNFQNILSNLICISESTRQPFALIMMDIDHFKNVNDSYGHDIGDLVLKYFADILTDKKRSGDFLFRWGGEEFVLILPGITAENAYSFANRTREYIATHPFINNAVNITYTVSMGIYIGQGKEGNVQIMEIADKNLYQAKKLGRNCVVINVLS